MPSNTFFQEPRSPAEIRTHADTYGVTFSLTRLCDVNGINEHPIFRLLKSEKGPPLLEWNFVKFLVDRSGRVVQRYAPTTLPSQLVDDVEALL